jgi:hypothetical protein
VESGVTEKHDFRSIQQKIPRESNFANNRDMNPLPHVVAAADLVKMFAQNFFLRKSVFGTKNTIFAKIRVEYIHNFSGEKVLCPKFWRYFL